MKINLPTKEVLLTGGIAIPLAVKGESWSKSCLGDYRERSGVYLHYCEGEVVYVGKATAGRRGNFGDRMRREFQETSASNDYLHRFIKAHVDHIKTKFLDLDEIDSIVDGQEVVLSKERKALILEQILIGQYEPRGNRV